MKTFILCVLLFCASYCSAFEWLSIDNEEVDIDTTVLLWDDTQKRVVVGSIQEYVWYYLMIEDMMVEVTHWAPLPKPPKFQVVD